ncbi:site-specific integrase [Streptosporangium sp. NPDC051023]|uniref:tyrosine-type recombinase/integrase n=1 Tax=Streptosporangium sp. NPDC051023 TaxID=3155410 RepID=UPI003450DEED
MRSAPNPQRHRRTLGAPEPGSVNLRTGKPTLPQGYAKRTVNHVLSVVSGFYQFHGHRGHGPVINPVPSSAQRRRALSHLSPLEPEPVTGRARLRQKVPDRPPRAIPDRLWDELFEAMGCERDRALLEFSVSSGARAAELLGVTPEDVDWAGRQIFVISKGTRLRQPVPASPQAFVRLALYLDEVGTLTPGDSIWRVRRGDDRPLSYWALRRIMQRANHLLGTNWTWHDLRHTAAIRMANSGQLTLPEVQAILRHANIQTTSRYLTVGIEELFDKLTEHYARPRPEPRYSSGYAAADIEAVFGG